MAIRLTPDGVHYLAMAAGGRVCAPFAFRPLVPLLAGWLGGLAGFRVLAAVSVAIAAGLFGRTLAAAGLPAERCLAGVLVFLLHPWCGRWLLSCPVLVDGPSAALVALGCWAAIIGDPYLFCVALLLAAVTREAAIGLIAAAGLLLVPGGWWVLGVFLAGGLHAIMRAQNRRSLPPPPMTPDLVGWYGSPRRVLRTAIRYHRWRILDLSEGWSALIPLALIGWFSAPPELQALWPIVPAAAAQSLMGTDRARFQACAWPAVIAWVVCL